MLADHVEDIGNVLGGHGWHAVGQLIDPELLALVLQLSTQVVNVVGIVVVVVVVDALATAAAVLCQRDVVAAHDACSQIDIVTELREVFIVAVAVVGLKGAGQRCTRAEVVEVAEVTHLLQLGVALAQQ